MTGSSFTLDGRPVPFNPGDTILEAARRAGRYIPSLCYHRRTGALATCRICVVAIVGRDGLHPSCATAAAAGLEARSDTAALREARRSVVALLLDQGDHDCRSCRADGRCELQSVARSLGLTWSGSGRKSPGDQSAPMIVRLPDKCILCGRCVAACSGTVVNDVLSFAGRGDRCRLICDNDLPMGSSSCAQCGECVQLCPTGALDDHPTAGDRLPAGAGTTVETICPYCGVGCGLTLEISGEKIVAVSGTEGHPVNDGMLCVKGRYGLSFVGSRERLTLPLLRTPSGELQPVTWEKAIGYTAQRFREISTCFGPDAAAGLSSAKCTNEENYLFQKLLRAVIGTNNVDHCARLCHSSTVSAMSAAIGSGAMTNSIVDIDEADVICVVGSDTSAAHPVIASRIKRAVRRGSAKLIVIDPKRIELARHAAIHAQPVCGTDVAVINGLIHIIIRDALEDRTFIASHCQGYDELAASVEEYTPAMVSGLSGIPAETLERAAALFGNAPRGAVFFAMGITQHTSGTDNVRALVNLQLLCGNFGRPGTGLNPLRGQCNVQGACDMGALPDRLPGYLPVDDGQGRRLFERAWGVSLPPVPGLTALEMVDAAGGGDLKALYIVGENPCLSDPDIAHVRQALSRLELLVVQDIFLTETAALADVVLPAASFAEKDGHFTNTERRVQRLRRALTPPGEALEDWTVFSRIAAALGMPWTYEHAGEIHDEMRSLVPAYRGTTWDGTNRVGRQWPVTSPGHPGTPILHSRGFPGGRARMSPVSWRPPAEVPDDDYPFLLTTGRLLPHFHTGTMSRRSPGLNSMAGPQAVLAEEDGLSLGIAEGEVVEVRTRRGCISAPARLSPDLPPGLVFIPFHFHEAPANALTNPARDPVAKIPELKVCAAAVRKTGGKGRRPAPR